MGQITLPDERALHAPAERDRLTVEDSSPAELMGIHVRMRRELNGKQRKVVSLIGSGVMNMREAAAEAGVRLSTVERWYTDASLPAFRSCLDEMTAIVSRLYATSASQKRKWLHEAIVGSLSLGTAQGFQAAIKGVEALDMLDNPGLSGGRSGLRRGFGHNNIEGSTNGISIFMNFGTGNNPDPSPTQDLDSFTGELIEHQNNVTPLSASSPASEHASEGAAQEATERPSEP
jgi:hypothetical protein